jgi:hypothetical protein
MGYRRFLFGRPCGPSRPGRPPLASGNAVRWASCRTEENRGTWIRKALAQRCSTTSTAAPTATRIGRTRSTSTRRSWSSRSPASDSRASPTSASGGGTTRPTSTWKSAGSVAAEMSIRRGRGPLRRRTLELRRQHPRVPRRSDRRRDDLLRRTLRGARVAGPVASRASADRSARDAQLRTTTSA